MNCTENRKRTTNFGTLLLFAGFLAFVTINVQAELPADTPFDTARIFHVMAKARQGEPITIGVIGGSITAGSLASTEDKRWANLVTEWWRTQFPSSTVALVNAGVGATGSDQGTFRIQKDLLSKHPDFVVVEFAVNDAGEESHYVQEMMEGCVRQLLADTNDIGVMLLLLKMEDGGTAQDDHKVAGDYYKIPWVSQVDLIGPALAKEGLVLSQVYGDTPHGVHPNDLGMQYIADFITERLDSVYAHLPADADLPEINTTLPEPLVTDIYTRTYTFTAATLVASTNSGWDTKGSVWSSETPGAELVFTVDGNAVAVKYDKKFSTDRGRAEVWVDEGPHTVIDAFFTETWGTKPCFQLVEEGLPDGEHTLHVKILAEHDPQSNGNYLNILSVYKAGNITNASPIAVPGTAKKTLIENAVILDAGSSYDPDGDTITTYQWSVEKAPNGSSATIESGTAVMTSFTPDLAGYYNIGLIVNVGAMPSVQQTVSIHAVASNTVPLADAGEDIILATGKRAKPDGSKSSDADGDPITYVWSFILKPEGSTASIMSANTATPYFFASTQGEYLVSLVVNDSIADSPVDTVKITAIDGYSALPDVNSDAQNIRIFPNPARDFITMQYQLTSPMQVKIMVFSTDGRLLSQPVYEHQKTGSHELNLSVESLSSAGKSLIIQVEAGNEVFRQKVMLF
jgi:lysophospholipase L1-like esterase